MMNRAIHTGANPLSMNNFKTGQLCQIVKDAFNSNLPDDKVTHGGVLVSQIPLSSFKLKAILEGTPVLVVNVLETYVIGLIEDKLYFIDAKALEDL
jgi:hypothetical protein